MYARLIAYDVLLNGEKIDTVFYNEDFRMDEILKSLIDHDGYSPNVVLTRSEEVE